MKLRNKYRIEGNLVYILLKNKKGEEHETVINAWHLDQIAELGLSWHLQWDTKTQSYYCKATRYLGVKNDKPKYQTLYLHTVVSGDIPKGKMVHHKNHDTLDNRDINLVTTDSGTNSLIRKGANPNSTTGIRNVSYCKTSGKYLVQLQVNGKNIRFGTFVNLEDAKNCAEINREKYYPKL